MALPGYKLCSIKVQGNILACSRLLVVGSFCLSPTTESLEQASKILDSKQVYILVRFLMVSSVVLSFPISRDIELFIAYL